MKLVGRRATNVLLSMAFPFLPTMSSQMRSSSANEGYAIDSLASILQTPSIAQQEVLSQALRIVHSMESAPTCNRLAALNLINDCKSLEQSPDNVQPEPEMALDEVKSEYAARLAVCELLGAKAPVPRECGILVPSPEACGKGRFSSFFSRQKDSSDGEYCYPEATHTQFERCLRALESRPQSWTSYSNARQNAVVMCHASRDAIEREHNLAVYKSLIEVVDHMASTLSTSMRDMQTWVAEQMSFAEKIQSSQDRAMQDMQTSREMALTTFDTVRSSLRSFTGMMKQAAEAVTQDLHETLHKSKASIEEAREEMQGLYKDLAEVSTQHSVAQKDQLQSNHELALASLQLNHEAAVYSLNTLSNSINTLQGRVEASSESVDNLNQGLVNLNKTVQDLGSATENLQSMIHATTESFQMLASLSGSVVNPKIWAAIAVCIFGLWNANRKIAGYFMAACSFVGLLYSLDIQVLIETLLDHTQRPMIPIVRHFTDFLAAQTLCSLVLPTVAALCLLPVAIWSFLDSTFLYQYQDAEGGDGVLPRVETPVGPATPSPKKPHPFRPFRAFRFRS